MCDGVGRVDRECRKMSRCGWREGFTFSRSPRPNTMLNNLAFCLDSIAATLAFCL